MEQKKPRVACFDRIRVIGMAAVVYSAVCGLLIQQGAADGHVLTFSWHVANLFGAATQFAVPLLLMGLGALLLEKESSVSLKEVLRDRVLMLLIPLAVWSLIYMVFRFLWQGPMGEQIMPADMLRSLLNTPAAPHLWLFYLLIAVYLLLPFLRLLVQHAPRGLILYATILWIGYNSFFPILSGLFPNLALPAYGSANPLGGYLGYLLLGWLLFTTEWRPSRRLMLIGYGISVIATAIGAALMTHSAGEANVVFYQAYMPNIILMSIFLFMVCRDFDRSTVFSPWLPPMAQFSMGMYGVFELFYLLLVPVMRSIPLIVSFLFAPPLIWVLSLISVAFMRRVKIVRLLFMGDR